MKCKYNENIICDFDNPEHIRLDCRSFNCEPYEKGKRVSKLEQVGLNWFEIADILSTTYDEVRYISENYLIERGNRK